MCKKEFFMLFKLSNYYCKYVINVINKAILENIKNRINYDELDDKLYESYLKLEEILNYEISNM